MTLTREQFFGTWTLVEWRIEYSNERVKHPFSRNAVGQLIYNADGGMSATVSTADRPRFERSNIRQAKNEQKSGWFESYFHYAGTWCVETDSVVHTVECALNPNFVGTRQVRKAVFDTDKILTLAASEVLADKSERRHILKWERVS